MKGKFVRIYYPPDSNCSTFLLANCLASKNRINLIVATKKEIPDLLTMEEAKIHCEAGKLNFHIFANTKVLLCGLGWALKVESILMLL